MTHFPIQNLLLPLLRRKRATRLWLGLAFCWLLGCLVGLGFLLMGVDSGGLSPLVLPGLGIATGVAAVVYWIRHHRARPDWRACALQIETRYPDLDGRLLTALEQAPDAQGRFSYLQQRLFDEVLAHEQRVRWNAVAPRSRVGFVKLTHALAVAAFLVICLKLGTLPAGRVAGSQAGGEVVITPGDTCMERGSQLVILARFHGQVPASVDLVVRQVDQPVRRIPLVRSLEDPMFGGGLPEVTGALEYSLEYGGQRSPAFSVTVFDYPKMERADADLVYPEYTSLPPKHLDNARHLSAVAGTRVDWTLHLNKPVASAQLVPRGRDSEPVRLEPHAELPQVRLTAFVLTESGRYSLQLIDAEGRTNQQPVQFSWNVFPNRVPELQITAPRGDIRPSALEEVSFGGTVVDDFGVLAYGLAYFISGQELQTIELGTRVPAQEKRSFEHVIAFEDLGLDTGDLVSWFFWSEDLGPDGQIRRTMGDLYFAEVRPFDEIFRQGQPQFGSTDSQPSQSPPQSGGGGQTAKLAELQQQIIHATWKLQREQGAANSRNPAPPQSSRPAAPTRGVLGGPAADATVQIQKGRQPIDGFLREILDSSAHSFGGPHSFFAQQTETKREDSPLRRERPAAAVPTDLFRQDVQVVIDAQRDALAQAEEARLRQEDPRAMASWGEAIQQMQSALEQLIRAADSPSALQDALAAQQAAYQRLLRLQEREFSVSQSRNQGDPGSQSGRQQQMQRQLDQLELTAEENRYETERLASAPQSAEQREQLQVMSRLAELARRQQDLNEQLQELQTALQAAQTEEAREPLRKELKRLQEEQQQMLADVDELRQRMDSQENSSQFQDQRQQLEQTRESLQRAAEAAQQGEVSQALAAGTRAQREMQEMREELRNQSAGAFAEDLRQMRSEARELTRQQEAIQNQIETLDDRPRRSLSESDGSEEVRQQIAQQRQRLTNLVEQATQVSQLAENAEPLLSTALHDTLREFSQDDVGAVKQVQEDLLANGMFPLYQRLKEIVEESGARTLDMTSEVLGAGLLELAGQTGQRAQQDISDLANGIERAAEFVLGDDSEALRRAQRELEDLTEQLAREMARAEDRQTNAQGQAFSAPVPESARPPGEAPEAAAGERAGENRNASAPGEAQFGPVAESGTRPQGRADSNQGPNGNPGTGQQPAQSPSPGSPGLDPQANPGGFDLDQLVGGGQPGGTRRTGPITGGDFGPWSDRLRELEELVELPQLRNELIRAREQARQLRREYTRDQQKPDWAQVQLRVVEPLVEVRRAIGEELARRQSRESLVPIDRDPVPERYSEWVRRYYEELGKDYD